MRKHTTADAEAQIMLASRRRCALCFGLNGDLSQKRGQLAHVNRDSSDSRPENLCFLCLPHHDEYDSVPRQSKGITPKELLEYRTYLINFIEKQPDLPWTDLPRVEGATKRPSSEYAIVNFYERRIRVYRAAKTLIGAIVRSSCATPDELWTFVRGTDEAEFLFDDDVAAYLFELYKETVRLEYIGKKLEHVDRGPERQRLTSEEMELRLWFTRQFEVLRDKFVPFLRV